ncbi:unnamed protein product, partial [Porites evermanni]
MYIVKKDDFPVGPLKVEFQIVGAANENDFFNFADGIVRSLLEADLKLLDGLYIPKMKKTSFKYGSDAFDKSYFLIEDDSDVPRGTHRHYSFTGYLDGLNRRA